MTAFAATLAALVVGTSEPGVFFTPILSSRGYGDPVTPLGSATNRGVRLDVNAAQGMIATLDGLMERAVLPALYDYAPLCMGYPPARVSGGSEIPKDWRHQDWTNKVFYNYSQPNFATHCPFPMAAQRDITSIGDRRIFPRIREMLSEAETFIRTYVQGLKLQETGWAFNAGSTLFGNNDTITIPLTDKTNVTDTATEFLTRANLGFSSLPECKMTGFLRGSEYSLNALSSIFEPAPARYTSAMLNPLADYQKEIAEASKEWSLSKGLFESTNRFARISSEELGRINTFLALFNKTYSDGVVPVFAQTNLSCTCRISWTVTGTATASKSGDYKTWNVALETGDKTVEFIRDDSSSAGLEECSASVDEVNTKLAGLVLGSRDIKISKSDFREKFRRTNGATNELEHVTMYIPEDAPTFIYVDVGDMRAVYEANRDKPLTLSGVINRTNQLIVRQPLQMLPVLPAAEVSYTHNGSCPPLNPAKVVVDKGYITEFHVQSAGTLYGKLGTNRMEKVWADARQLKSGRWDLLVQTEAGFAEVTTDKCIDLAKELTGFPFNSEDVPNINYLTFSIGDTIPDEATTALIDDISGTATAPVFITQTYNGEVYARYVGDQDPILVYKMPGDDTLYEVEIEDGSYNIGYMSTGARVEDKYPIGLPYKIGSASARVRITHAAHWKFKNLPLVEESGE